MDSTRKSLFTSTAAGMIGMLWFSIAFGIPTSMLFESLTGSGIMLGIFSTFIQLSAVFQVPSAIFSEHFQNRKRYWGFLSMANRILWLAPVIVILCFWNRPTLAALILMMLLALATCFANCAGPIWLDWMADIIPREISERYWGIRQSLTAVSFFVGTALAGQILDAFPVPEKPGGSYTGFLIVFAIGAVAGILDILLHLKVPDTKRAAPPPATNLMDKLAIPMKDRDFRNMTLAYASWFLAMGIVGPFGFIYLKRVFGTSYTDLSIIASVASLSAVLFGYLNGMLIDRVGSRAFFCIALALIPPFWAVWFFAGDTVYGFQLMSWSFHIPETILLISAASFMAGILGSGVAICQIHLANAIADRSWRRIGIAEHWAIVGIVSATGPFIGGAITDYFTKYPLSLRLPSGQNMSYIHILIILSTLVSWTIAIPFMMKVKMSKDDMSIESAITAIYLYPLRGFGLALNFLRNIADEKDK